MVAIKRRALLLGAAAMVPAVALAPLGPTSLFTNGGIVPLPPATLGEDGREFIVPLSMDQMIAGVVCMVAVSAAVAEVSRTFGVP